MEACRKMRPRSGRRKTNSIGGGGGPLLMAAALLAASVWAQPAAAFFIDSRQSPASSEWHYGDQEAWARQNRDCAGRAQSPIDIQHKNVIISQHLRLHFYNYNQQLKFQLSNAHHTIKMDPFGPAYDYLPFGEAGGVGGAGAGSPEGRARHFQNASSIHDMITADEYVEFSTGGAGASASSQQQPDPSQNAAAAATNSKQQLQLQQQQQQQQNKERLLSAAPADPNRPPTGSITKPTSVKPVGRARQPLAHSMAPPQPPPPPQLLHPNGIEREAPAGSSSVGADGVSSEPYEGAPTIKLDWLDDGNNEYKLRDIHFHWGERRDNGSEHAIDGRRAAMEMHLVHIKHGLDKSKIGFTSDSVAVIAILIESHRKSNADFNPIVNELARINATHAPQLIEYKSIYDLLPSTLDAFYTYSGSLTTPPCYQVVNWIVMAERLNMNAKQIEMFRNLYAPPHEEAEDAVDEVGLKHPTSDDGDGGGGQADKTGHDDAAPADQPDETDSSRGQHKADQAGASYSKLIMPNVRAIQPLNNRTILASFERHGNRIRVPLSHSNSIHLEAVGNTLIWNAFFYHIGLLVSIISLARNYHTLT